MQGTWKRAISLVLAILLLSLCLIILSVPARADSDSISEVQEQELAQRFSPILQFKEGERLFPCSVEYFIANSNLNRSDGLIPELVDPNPTEEDLALYAGAGFANYYLDNRLGGIDDERIIEDYEANEDSLGYTVYYRVTETSLGYVVQYWLFYVFNPGTLNNHEGDWEMVQVSLNDSLQPTAVMYSQHESGVYAQWGDTEVGGEGGDHIKVYVAKGSHANYLRYYQGKTGMAQDEVGNDGRKLMPEDYTLINLGEHDDYNLDPYTGWIQFGGRWGDYGTAQSEFRGERGPLGPVFRQGGEMWADPLGWGAGLTRLDTSSLPLEIAYYYIFWVILSLLVMGVLWTIFRVLRRKRKGELRPPYSPFLDFHGPKGRKLANVLAMVAIVIAFFSIFMPYYVLSLEVPSGDFTTDDYVDIFFIDGKDGMMVTGIDETGAPSQLLAIPLPFGWLLALTLVMLVLSTIAIDQRKVWGKYLRRGILLLLPLFIVILVATTLTNYIPEGLDQVGAEGARQVFEVMGQAPLGGEDEILVSEYGTVNARWGVGVGVWLMLLAGVLLIIAAIIHRYSDPKKSPAEDSPKDM